MIETFIFFFRTDKLTTLNESFCLHERERGFALHIVFRFLLFFIDRVRKQYDDAVILCSSDIVGFTKDPTRENLYNKQHNIHWLITRWSLELFNHTTRPPFEKSYSINRTLNMATTSIFQSSDVIFYITCQDIARRTHFLLFNHDGLRWFLRCWPPVLRFFHPRAKVLFIEVRLPFDSLDTSATKQPELDFRLSVTFHDYIVRKAKGFRRRCSMKVCIEVWGIDAHVSVTRNNRKRLILSTEVLCSIIW